MEILIVNDGSLEDRTGEVADEYEKKYPGICRAIHQENGGHGAAINIGLQEKGGVGYQTVFPLNKRFTWRDVKRFGIGQYILMHSVIYRTGLLRECGLVLPRHTFYVDNIVVYQPLPYVEDMYYLDVNFYRYFIGRKD